MIKRSVRDYILIGASLRFLQDSVVGQPIKGSGLITGNIDRFLKELDKLELNVTKRASRDLKKLFDKFNGFSDETRLDEPNRKILNETVTTLRTTFQAETEGIQAIIITDKRYSIGKLENIRTLLDIGVYEKLPDLARYDLDECGLCICFERNTAAAFHLLRATEEILKHFHKKYIRKKYTVSKTWGNYTNELRTKNTGKKPDVIIINHLDNIRNSFRNPTQHPDKKYDMEEVQNLLGVCLDVINRMGKEL